MHNGGSFRITGRAMLVLVFAVCMVAPMATLLMYAFADSFTPASPWPTALTMRWFEAFAANPRAISALGTSLVLAVVSTALSTVIGLPLAWALSRRKPRLAAPLEAAILMRSAVPVIVLGIGTAALLYRFGAIDTWFGLIAAHTAGCLPFILIAVRPALTSLDESMLEAAHDLGANAFKRFLLAMRIITPSIVSGALFAFIFSLDEFGLTFLISGINIVTLPVLLYGAVQSSSVSAAAAIAVVLLVPSLLVSALALFVSRRADITYKGASA